MLLPTTTASLHAPCDSPSATNDFPSEFPPAVLLLVDKLLTLPMSLVVLTTATAAFWLDPSASLSHDAPSWLLVATVVAVPLLMLAVWIVVFWWTPPPVSAGTCPLLPLLRLLVTLPALLMPPVTCGTFSFFLAGWPGPLRGRFLPAFELFPLLFLLMPIQCCLLSFVARWFQNCVLLPHTGSSRSGGSVRGAAALVCRQAGALDNGPEGNGQCRTARRGGVTPVFVTSASFLVSFIFPDCIFRKTCQLAHRSQQPAVKQATSNKNVSLLGLDHHSILALFATTLSKHHCC